ncbi:hypothetical protein [Rhodobacter calidifons]|uniref:Uncharacterized protein n=1 Tax=Rhodobacter calidifons TaxID=2715277 RepID=A0ABX0G8U5_9RHOB|nr:hypothetical protein [Rhodobacter calidifons]NHB77705.1 hypothetical protein [Rhodobacter calidifons]
MISWLFTATLGLSVASFVVFVLSAWWAYRLARVAAAAGGGATFEAAGTDFPDLAKLAEAFAKAGTPATAAALSIFVMFVALLVAGVVELSVDTKP